MISKYDELLKAKMGDTYHKLEALQNEKLNDFLGEYISLCNPDKVYMCNDSKEDAEFIRKRALELGEEAKLAKKGQTIHFDGYGDQGRDKANTRFMVPGTKRAQMGKLNCVDYDEGLAEIKSIAKNIMQGKAAFRKNNRRFSVPWYFVKAFFGRLLMPRIVRMTGKGKQYSWAAPTETK